MINRYYKYQSFDNTNLKEIFDNHNHNIILSCTAIVSIALCTIPQLINDISSVLTDRITTNNNILSGSIFGRSLLIIGFTIPAILFCVYSNNAEISCKIYCSMANSINLYFGFGLFSIIIPVIDSIHFTASILFLLTLYTISCVLSLFVDYGSNLNSLNTCSLVLQSISYLVYLFPIYNIGVVFISKYSKFSVSPQLKESVVYMYCFLLSSFIYFVVAIIVFPFQSTREINKEMVIVPLWLDACILFYALVLSNTDIRKRLNQSQFQELVSLNENSNREKEFIESIISDMVPAHIAKKMISGDIVYPESFQFVTLMFSDVISFTTYASNIEPFEVFKMLNRLYKIMDSFLELFPTLYKLETVGDAIVIVGGVLGNGNCDMNYRQQVMIEMTEYSFLVNEVVKRIPMNDESNVKIRIGLHTGTVVGGIFGINNPRFCLYGDAMNVTARLEQNGESNKIHTSQEFINNLDQYSVPSNVFSCIKRDPIEIKGKGVM